MSLITITKRFEFEAAHYLPNHEGKCRQLHGHSYKMDVTIMGPVCDEEKSPRRGMILDFAELKDIVTPLISHDPDNPVKSVDHGLLNNVFPYPTAEEMVRDFAYRIQNALDKQYKHTYVHRIDLWENSSSYASWICND